ncbi:MAG: hypothetical protein HW421_1822 [Ignavibacteria bacterium]|nr:hypothetical protein [Ignavibacteria bacterium]
MQESPSVAVPVIPTSAGMTTISTFGTASSIFAFLMGLNGISCIESMVLLASKRVEFTQGESKYFNFQILQTSINRILN